MVRPAPNVDYQRYVATPADMRAARGGFAIDPRRLAVPAAILIGLLLLFLIGRAAVGAISSAGSKSAASPRASATHTATPRPTATPTTARTPTPDPRATPSFGPAAAAPVNSVQLRVSGCTAGGSCSVEVQVNTSAAAASNRVAWTIKGWDACTGTVSDLAQDGVQQEAGWTSVIGDRTFTAPGARVLYLVAVTSAPATAASQLYPVNAGAAC